MPCSRARWIDRSVAMTAATWPGPLSPSTSATAPSRRTTRGRGCGLSTPVRSRSAYTGTRATPCESTPRRLVQTRLSATVAAGSGSRPEPSSSARVQRSSSTAGTVSAVAGRLPEVDAGLDRVAVDRGQLVVREVEVVERAEAVLELRHAAGADQGRRHARVAQRPRDRHLRERLPAALCHLVERAHVP